MVTTTIAAGCGALSTLTLGSFIDSRSEGKMIIRLEYANNGVLAGLVGITASCSVVEPYAAAIIGCGASFMYVGASKLLVKCGIDDVVDAFPVHGACGAYGVIMAALFATSHNYAAAYGIYDGAEKHCEGFLYSGKTNQLEANGAFVIVVLLWSGFMSLLVFVPLRLCGLLRIPPDVEEEGLDSSEHGARK